VSQFLFSVCKYKFKIRYPRIFIDLAEFCECVKVKSKPIWQRWQLLFPFRKTAICALYYTNFFLFFWRGREVEYFFYYSAIVIFVKGSSYKKIRIPQSILSPSKNCVHAHIRVNININIYIYIYIYICVYIYIYIYIYIYNLRYFVINIFYTILFIIHYSPFYIFT